MTVHRITFRAGTYEQWWKANPILAVGEPGFESDTNRLKVGNGWSTWRSLTYLGEPPAKRNMRQVPISPSERAIVLRKDETEALKESNPILGYGEPCFEITTNQMRVGDGQHSWSELEDV